METLTSLFDAVLRSHDATFCCWPCMALGVRLPRGTFLCQQICACWHPPKQYLYAKTSFIHSRAPHCLRQCSNQQSDVPRRRDGAGRRHVHVLTHCQRTCSQAQSTGPTRLAILRLSVTKYGPPSGHFVAVLNHTTSRYMHSTTNNTS